MQIYLVGGAVRDECLGRNVKDRDWVVVGATPQDMLDKGFQPVGRDFPVFLHPYTHEEYALARTERKHGHGYHGFVTHFDPGVTLEDDLLRRDLTINAMAKNEQGEIIDPYGGLRDLEQRMLRHVSPAFVEDPLRVLRVARFAARYHTLGFTVAADTLALMQAITRSGELQHLVAERVWQEVQHALMEQQPSVFFQTLHQAGALAALFPELAALDGVPQTAQYHPEIDTWVHTCMVLDLAAREAHRGEIRFAALTHDLGKALTPRAEWPKHIGHEQRGLAPLQQLCQRLRCPKTYQRLAELACRWHLVIHQALDLRPTTLLKLFEATRAFRQPQRFADLLHVCSCDARGRLGREDRPYPQQAYLAAALQCVQHINSDEYIQNGLRGAAIGEAIRRERMTRLREHRKKYQAVTSITPRESP